MKKINAKEKFHNWWKQASFGSDSGITIEIDPKAEDLTTRFGMICASEAWIEQQKVIDKQEKLLREACGYIKKAKAKFTPHTTNSFVDDFISKTGQYHD